MSFQQIRASMSLQEKIPQLRYESRRETASVLLEAIAGVDSPDTACSRSLEGVT